METDEAKEPRKARKTRKVFLQEGREGREEGRKGEVEPRMDANGKGRNDGDNISQVRGLCAVRNLGREGLWRSQGMPAWHSGVPESLSHCVTGQTQLPRHA